MICTYSPPGGVFWRTDLLNGLLAQRATLYGVSDRLCIHWVGGGSRKEEKGEEGGTKGPQMLFSRSTSLFLKAADFRCLFLPTGYIGRAGDAPPLGPPMRCGRRLLFALLGVFSPVTLGVQLLPRGSLSCRKCRRAGQQPLQTKKEPMKLPPLPL